MIQQIFETGIKLARVDPGFSLVAVMRRLFAAVIWFLLATGLRAETYQEWEKLIPAVRPIPFKAWLAPSTAGSTIEGKSYSTFESPLGHLFGHLDFSSFPPDDFPLRLRVLYYRIGESGRNPTPNGDGQRGLTWTSPLHYIAPDAYLGELAESREIDIASAAEGGAIPVWSVWTNSSRGQYEGGDPYSVLIEVARHDGTLLARERLIEAVASGATRDVCLTKTNSGAEAYVKSVGEVKSVDVLPTEERVYEDVRLLWLDDATLHDPAYPDSFWHGVFFAGTTVFGQEAEVQELAQRLGISANQRVLQGGLWTAGHSMDDLTRQTNNNGGQYTLHVDKGENPFEKKVVLGRRRTHELRNFSMWFLVVFTVFEIAIIIGSLYLLHGPRRVFRWLLIPVSAIVYTALGLIVVHFVVDFRPEVEIFREVDSVEGWPEGMVSTDITRLGFDDGRSAFTAPPTAEYRWASVDEGTTPLLSLPVEEQMNFSMRQRYGRFANSHIQYQMPAESPCQLTANGEIVATRPLSGAWMWDGKFWRNLGPMLPGKPVAIDTAGIAVDPRKLAKDNANAVPIEDGNPYPYENAFPETVRAFCSTAYMRSLKATNVGVLLAIDERGVPEQMEDAAGSEIRTQTLLVHQFQLPAPAPQP